MNKDYTTNLFALGSSQYVGIYNGYLEKEKNKAVKNELFSPMVDYQKATIDFFLAAIPEIVKEINDNAKEWGEVLDTSIVDDISSLQLKLGLLLAKKDNDIELKKRMLLDLFNLMKNQAWDLWSALGFTVSYYPELSDLFDDFDNDVNNDNATVVYFFGELLKLNDKEVREIFGGFDT